MAAPFRDPARELAFQLLGAPSDAASTRCAADMVAAMAPADPVTVAQWADRHRIMSAKGTSEAGPWRTSRTPYLREVMDALSMTSSYTDIWVSKGAQLGFTEVGLNFLLWIIDCAPGPALAVQATLPDVKRWVRQKVDPAIQETPRVREKIPPPRAKEGGNSVLLKEFPGGLLLMAGANSASSLRSASIRYLFLDEIDGYPSDLDGEGDPVHLARARTRTYPRAKRFYCSTPTVTGASRIEDGFFTTDQRKYFVPCPHCQRMQVIEWSAIRWDASDLSRPAWWTCVAGCVVEEHHKVAMLAAGEWRATCPEKASDKVVGFHLSALYAPYGWYSWSNARDEFLEAEGSPVAMKTWTNLVLGESYREVGEVPAWRELMARAEPYPRGTVPAGGLLLTAGVDVQGDRLEVEVRAWGRRHESWSVDYMVLDGDTADLDSASSPWRALAELMARGFPVAGSEARLTIEKLAVDSGYRAHTVYLWARSQERSRVSVIKGSDTQPTAVGVPTEVDIKASGKRFRRGARLWPVGVGVIKGELYGWLRHEHPGPDEPYPIGWMHFPAYPQEYFEQLVAEELVSRTLPTGHVRRRWEKRRERNEALDCAVYARAAAVMCGIDRWDEADWMARAEGLGLAPAPSEAKPAQQPSESAPAPKSPKAAPKSPKAAPKPKPKPKPAPRRGSFWAKRR